MTIEVPVILSLITSFFTFLGAFLSVLRSNPKPLLKSSRDSSGRTFACSRPGTRLPGGASLIRCRSVLTLGVQSLGVTFKVLIVDSLFTSFFTASGVFLLVLRSDPGKPLPATNGRHPKPACSLRIAAGRFDVPRLSIQVSVRRQHVLLISLKCLRVNCGDLLTLRDRLRMFGCNSPVDSGLKMQLFKGFEPTLPFRRLCGPEPQHRNIHTSLAE